VRTSDRRELRRSLQRLAAGQAGYFSSAQARSVGYSYQAQRYHVEHNNWDRVDRGIFRLKDWPAGEHDDLVLWTLWSRDRGVISHETALSVHGLGDINPATIHLTVPKGFRASAPGVVLHHAELQTGDIESHTGYRITTAIRSILDVAAFGIETERLASVLSDWLARGPANRRSLQNRADELGPAAALRIHRALTEVAE